MTARALAVRALLAGSAVAALLATAPVTLSATPPGTYGGTTEDAGLGLGPLVPIAAIAALVVLAVAAVQLLLRRAPRAARLVGAGLIMLGTAAAVFLVLAVGVLSSWTDEGTNVPLPFVIGAIAVGVAGLVAAALTLRGLRRTGPPPPDATGPA